MAVTWTGVNAALVKSKAWDGMPFSDLETGEVDDLGELIRPGPYPAPGYEGADCFWLDTSDEHYVFRGGAGSSGRRGSVLRPLRRLTLVLRRGHRLACCSVYRTIIKAVSAIGICALS